jgi:hypothetical protein
MTEYGGEFKARVDRTKSSVASSDATNLKNTTARVEGDKVIVNGHKWVCQSLSRLLTVTVDFWRR